MYLFILKILFIYLTEKERAQTGGAEREGEMGSLLSGDHDLSRKQTLND